MKFEDLSQNLTVRITVIQIIGIIFLSILGARLYWLQIKRGEEFAKKAESQRLRYIRIPAPRGAIFDRNGKILVDSRPTFNVVLSHEPIKTINPLDRLADYEKGLGLDRQYLIDRLNFIKRQPDFETMVLKENATTEDIAWVEARQMEFPELRIEIQPQRHYPYGKILSHVLGYVGEIGEKQLEKPEYQNLKAGDIIGKGGLEQFYDRHLRGIDGYRKVLVDSRGRIQSELEIIQPQSGQDLISTIDIELQLAAEKALEESITKRGMMMAMDPRNGEVLALASAPAFDPNVFVQQSNTPDGRKQILAYNRDLQRPLLNRAIQGRYPPGSTWKIPESVGALRQGVITVKNSNVACGGGITIGNKFTRCMGSHGSPPLSYAITKSCDGYYYRLALMMGIDGLIKMIEDFEYDRRSGIDLPNEKVSQTPKSWMPTIIKQEGKWSDIRTVYASIGQDTVYVTPISMLRAVAAISVGGKLYTPHLLKQFKPVGAIGDLVERPAVFFDKPDPKIIEITPEQDKVMVDGMWAVVNGGGTAGAIKINGFDIAGKTGTAQVAELGKDVGDKKDHAWFVSFAPAYKPEISVIALIENSGFGGTHAAPAVKKVYEKYISLHHPTLANTNEKTVVPKDVD